MLINTERQISFWGKGETGDKNFTQEKGETRQQKIQGRDKMTNILHKPIHRTAVAAKEKFFIKGFLKIYQAKKSLLHKYKRTKNI